MDKYPSYKEPENSNLHIKRRKKASKKNKMNQMFGSFNKDFKKQ